jgi:mannose-6-phosphate isomerase-like protein (cupin superfamily)
MCATPKCCRKPNNSLPASFKHLCLLAAVALCSCATTPQHWFCSDPISGHRIDELLRRHRLPPNQNIRVTDLGRSDSISHHLVQIRVGEIMHIHRHHDLTVLLYRGHGVITVGTNTFPVRAKDVVFIPRGAPHAFTNRGRQPAVAIVVFSPAFDGKDTIPLEQQK